LTTQYPYRKAEKGVLRGGKERSTCGGLETLVVKILFAVKLSDEF